VSDKLQTILSYIDRPWKVFAVIALIIVGGAAWIIYDKRDILIEAWLTPATPELNVGAIPAALETLASESGADLVQVWSIDLSTNSQRFIAARLANGERPVIPNPRRLPIIVTVSDLRSLIEVLEGHPVCVPLALSGSPLARRLAERGMVRGCAIPIPPNPTAFVGVIYLAWEKVDPDESHEKVAVGAAREIAAKLATK
jgi:hypothetical protein